MTTKAEARLRFVGGKGGVGKTTCAAALAVRAADGGAQVLLVSTDPAHSLGDVLGHPAGPEPRPVPGADGLHASELDADGALRRWLDERRDSLRQIARRGTLLDDEDIEQLLRLSLPGVDELVGLIELDRLASERAWDRVVVDTAPTGHTLRLLETPDTLLRVAEIFDTMQGKHRVLAAHFGRGAVRDEAQMVLEAMYRDAVGLRDRLRDPTDTRFSWVTLAEPMATAETLDGLLALRQRDVAVDELLVNRWLQPEAGCAPCMRRAAAQREAGVRLATLAGLPPVRLLPEREREPAGLAALRDLAGHLGTSAPPGWADPLEAPDPPASVAAAPAEVVPAGARLVLFGGKGGVGKTSCVAACALAWCAEEASRRGLLLSVDPAHSLGDVLGAPILDKERTVPGGPSNLFVRELDAGAALGRERERYQASVDALFQGLTGGRNLDAPYDRAVLRELFDLAPPGIDELFAVVAVLDALLPSAGEATWERVWVDTAPTGHALRLLELPEVALQWVHALMRILLKYREAIGLGDLAEELLEQARRLKRLRALLTDPERTAFVVVTRQGAVVEAETWRLLDTLSARGIHTPAVVVNRASERGCAACTRAADADRRLATHLSQRGQHSIMAPELGAPPRGVTALVQWRHQWRAWPETQE